jgi:hypothetical protein
MGGCPSGQRELTVEGRVAEMDNARKGNLAVANAIRYYVSAGYTVSVPLADTARYDLVVERKGVFQAIQCKFAGYEGNPGVFSVPLYVSGGNRSAGNRRIKYQLNDFDILFILCASGRMYAIPLREVVGQTTINVGRSSRWSRWEQYLLSDVGGNCSLAEESAGEHFPNSAKPLGDGDAEPSPR